MVSSARSRKKRIQIRRQGKRLLAGRGWDRALNTHCLSTGASDEGADGGVSNRAAVVLYLAVSIAMQSVGVRLHPCRD